jgi:hypothetical protein
VLFEQLFDGARGRADLIVTFLAILEMTRLRLTRVEQDGPLAPIFIELAVVEDGDQPATTDDLDRAYEGSAEIMHPAAKPAAEDFNEESDDADEDDEDDDDESDDDESDDDDGESDDDDGESDDDDDDEPDTDETPETERE